MTAQELITKSMKLIGVLARGETPSMPDLTDGLVMLNDMVSAWSLDEFLFTGDNVISFPLTPGVSAYTIGIGSTVNVAKPTTIAESYIRDANNLEWVISPLSVGQWNALGDKRIASGTPQNWYYDVGATQQAAGVPVGTLCTVNITAPEGIVTVVAVNGAGTLYAAGDVLTVSGGNGDCNVKVLTVNPATGAVLTVSLISGGTGYVTASTISTTPHSGVFQAGTVNVYPIPDTGSAYTMVLNATVPFTDAVWLTTVMAFPTTYTEALTYNLAMRMAPGYGVTPVDWVQRNAIKTLKDIERVNFKPILSKIDVAVTGNPRWNIYSGDYQ